VLNLCLACVRANARYHQISVVGEFEDSIARVYRMLALRVKKTAPSCFYIFV